MVLEPPDEQAPSKQNVLEVQQGITPNAYSCRTQTRKFSLALTRTYCPYEMAFQLVYRHSPVARTFFLHTVRAQSHPHIFMRVHIHAWLSCPPKRFFAHVSEFSISPSFSCLTRHGCSCTVTSRPLPSYLSQKRRTCATPHMHRDVGPPGQVRCKHSLGGVRSTTFQLLWQVKKCAEHLPRGVRKKTFFSSAKKPVRQQCAKPFS